MADITNDLIRYIRSCFNLVINCDAKQFSDNSQLLLLNKPVYNIYVSPIYFKEIKARQEQYTNFIKEALSIYSAALLNMITFNIVTSSINCDIEVNWARQNIKTAGKAYHSDIKSKRNIVIGVIGQDEKLISSKEVFHIILHEFGHIFGLGHSPIEGDLMTPIVNETYGLSKNDIFVLQLIYSIGPNKTFFDEEKYINDCIKEFLNECNNQKQENNEPNKATNPVHNISLIEKLDNISDIKKYKILLQDIKLSTPIRV